MMFAQMRNCDYCMKDLIQKDPYEYVGKCLNFECHFYIDIFLCFHLRMVGKLFLKEVQFFLQSNFIVLQFSAFSKLFLLYFFSNK